MESNARMTLRTVAKLTLGALMLAAATGAAFAAWVDNGAGIFRTMVEAGLSWCM